MSARYYSSPALHLNIGNSRLRGRLYSLLCLIVVTALWVLSQRGYAGTACVLLLPLAALLWLRRGYRDEGLVVGWRQGHWYLQDSGSLCDVELAQRPVLTPWVIRLVLRDNTARHDILVYVDSVPAREWRRLNARLRLQGEHAG